MNDDVVATPRLERVPCAYCRDGKILAYCNADDGELAVALGRCAVCAGTGRILKEASER